MKISLSWNASWYLWDLVLLCKIDKFHCWELKTTAWNWWWYIKNLNIRTVWQFFSITIVMNFCQSHESDSFHLFFKLVKSQHLSIMQKIICTLRKHFEWQILCWLLTDQDGWSGQMIRFWTRKLVVWTWAATCCRLFLWRLFFDIKP